MEYEWTGIDWRTIWHPRKGRSNMSDIDIPGYGKLWVANKPDLPLLVVFGGIAVKPSQMDGIKRNKDDDKAIQSDVYMWNYVNPLKNRFHIFVSLPPRHVNGPKAYDALVNSQDQKFAPFQRILFLFSGGYLPGMGLLGDKAYANKFSAIFLVDIWMGNSSSADFYTHFVNTNADRVNYVFTQGGPANNDARDKLARKLGSQKAIEVDSQKGDVGYMTHMRTNTVAVGMLP
jgi:hypothetical protein